MLTPLKDLVQAAQAGHYAVGAFNFSNLEILKSITETAQRLSSPVIIQTSQSAIKYAGLGFIVAMARAAAEETDVPIALHLDHGTDLDLIKECIARGYSSVMIDGSHLPLEENIRITREVVALAHPSGVSVEAELGRLVGVEDEISVDEREASFTDPDEARRFVEATGVDALAVAIGTAHGQYKGEPKLDFDRLKQIAGAVETPLVLHGASGVPAESVSKAIKLGICKVNIDTDLRLAFHGAVKSFLESSDSYDPRKLLAPAMEAMSEVVATKINLFGSAGKAVR
ncbi:MAG: class II fructose-1,6-bisphosphate aldolase [Firmicutes bacterium]|nr:class II fructose-1,6-bisphosphate aldolase [Bacillota bacterium]